MPRRLLRLEGIPNVSRALDALDAHPTRIPQRSTRGDRMVTFMTNTNLRIALLSSLAGAILATATSADAEPTADTGPPIVAVAAISNAFEIAVGVGYMQGVGDIGDGMHSVEDLSKAGGGATLELAYRITPNLAIGGYGTLSGFDAGTQAAPSTDMVVGATAGLKVDWHFMPASSMDPWLSLGAGWRGLWLGNETATERELQGVDFARLQAGVDFRLTPDIAVSPYLGFNLGQYIAQGTEMSDGYERIESRKLNATFTGGVMARFDMFGSRGR